MSSHFTCYWDESGLDPGTDSKSKSNTPILLVGGYLAHNDEWAAFNSRWSTLLREAQLQYFHMAEFANMRFPYSTWTEERRESLIGSLLDIIADLPRIWVTWAIEIDAYMEIVKARNLLEKDIVRAYHICARKCIEVVHTWAVTAHYDRRITHVFDRGNSAWPTFEARFNRSMLDALNIKRPICENKMDATPLQAADILVHQTARHTVISSGRAREGIRLYTKRLFGKPGLPKFIGIEELKQLYREELMLEEARSRNQFPQRTINWGALSQDNINAVAHLFTDPVDYEVNRRIRELQ